jgi:hypothetical protein
MRRATMILVLLAISALLAACASSSHPAATAAGARATTGAHARTAAGAARSLTKAQAIAFARAVNLRATDLPGFRVAPPEHEHETAAEKRLESEMLRCAGAPSA